MGNESDKTEEFIRLFAANQRRIYALVTAVVPRAEEVDDLLQEISASLWQRFHKFTPGTDFGAWSAQFARFAILKYYRAQRRRGQVVFGDEVLAALIDEAAVAHRELDRRYEALRVCLERLPQRSRELVTARYEGGGASCKEVAGRLGRSVEAIYKSLHRVHELLLRCIERHLAAEDRA
jgi:RNA polymerase sigma-70 factor, ECF subfamily